MLKKERQKKIVSTVREMGAVDIKTLAGKFNVAEMTIRRDLEELDTQRRIIRTHGGATAINDNVLSENPYEVRAQRHIKQKEQIAQLALSFINNGDKVFFDSSTTVLCLAKLLTNSHDFLIVTDTLTTALEANKNKNTKVICLGGELKKSTGSCVSYLAEQALESMNFTTAFLSAPIISLDGTVSLSSISELSIKKKVMAHAAKCILMIDSSKLSAPDFLRFASISDFDTIITDSGIPQEFIALCNESNVNILVAKDEM